MVWSLQFLCISIKILRSPECESESTRNTEAKTNSYHGKLDWLVFWGNDCSGSTRVKKKTLFLVSAFFLEIFQKCFTLNCHSSKLQWSKDNCTFFQWLRILSCLQGHHPGQFSVFCLRNICTHTVSVCVWKRKERKEKNLNYKSIIDFRMYCLKQSDKQTRHLSACFTLLTLWLYFFRDSRESRFSHTWEAAWLSGRDTCELWAQTDLGQKSDSAIFHPCDLKQVIT